MKHVVEAGTDAAEVLLFDPGSLPEDFDARIQDDPASLLERMMQEGRVCVTETGGDGFFLLHAYVNEPLPAELQRYAHELRVVERYLVSSGRVYFSGVEYVF